jgi:V/A-type H+-transporting ATPase subunit E
MQDKLQEITDKIYREGVSRGNEEAEKIIAAARSESAKIIAKAEEEAKGIVAGSQKKATK